MVDVETVDGLCLAVDRGTGDSNPVMINGVGGERRLLGKVDEQETLEFVVNVPTLVSRFLHLRASIIGS